PPTIYTLSYTTLFRSCRKRLLFLLPRWKLRPSSSTRRGSILVENRINRPGRVKIPVGTSDQDAESLGRERSADWHSHLSLHGHRSEEHTSELQSRRDL